MVVLLFWIFMGFFCLVYATPLCASVDFCLFDLILYVHSTIFQLCGTGLPGLNQYLARINVSCSRTTTQWRRWGSNLRPFGLESSTLPLSHCAPYASVDMCLVVTCWERLTSWFLFVVSNCEFVTFPCGILGQVWYLMVSIPDLCTLTYSPYLKRVCHFGTA